MVLKHEMGEGKLMDMANICQAKDEKVADVTKLYEAAMNNLAAEMQLEQEGLQSLDTKTQLCKNKEEELAAVTSKHETSKREAGSRVRPVLGHGEEADRHDQTVRGHKGQTGSRIMAWSEYAQSGGCYAAVSEQGAGAGCHNCEV